MAEKHTCDGEIPATVRRVELPIAGFADLDADARFQDIRRYSDTAEMMRQLGLDE